MMHFSIICRYRLGVFMHEKLIDFSIKFTINRLFKYGIKLKIFLKLIIIFFISNFILILNLQTKSVRI